jgi:hypothetical protein
MSIKLSKQIMQDILGGEPSGDDGDVLGEVIEDKIIDTTRWSEIHDIVFLYKGKHYAAGYSCGLTEMQDESPWEYEEEVECHEVKKIERVVEVWKRV